MQKASGFTLMELMITIAIVAVITAIGVPSLIAWIPNYKLGSASRDVLAILQGTRLRAVKDNTSYMLLFDVGNQGYTAFLDDGAGTPDDTPADGIPDGRGNGLLDATERILVQKTLPAGTDIAGTTLPGNGVVFDTQGVASAAGTITIINNRGDTRRIVLELAGSSRIQP